jgi:DNA-binding NarL/FixJ family response regulator
VPDLLVAVVAADPLVRAGLVAVLAAEKGLRVVAQLTGEEDDAAGLVREAAGEVALWDLGAGRAVRVERLARAAARVPVLALVHHDEDAAEALSAGARGVLGRQADASRVVSALAAVRAGLLVMDEPMAPAVLRPRPSRPAALVEPLTPRESEVLQLLAQGLANKAIAERLGISEHTAKFHVNAILGKLGVQTRTEAIVHAARLGLVLL